MTAAVLVGVAHGATNPVIDGTLRKWHNVAITFEHDQTLAEKGPTNPFLDYRLQVTFTHVSTGVAYDVPGFFAADGDAADTSADAGDKWRVVFVPDRSGDWAFQASFRTGPGVAIAADPSAGSAASFDGVGGVITVAPADPEAPGLRRHGALRYVGTHYLMFAESHERYLKNGVDSPENLLGYYEFDNTYDLGGQNNDLHSNAYGDGLHHFDPHLADYQVGDPTWLGGGATPKGQRIIGAINYIASEGLNTSYFLTYNVDGGDGQEVWPWVEPGDKTRFDVSKLAQWGVLFDHMTDRGVVLHVVTQETENDGVLDGGALGSQRKLYYRELVARFAHNLGVIWNLGEENTNSDSQRKQYADFIRSIDPYDHPIVTHSFPYQIDSVYPPLLGYPTFDGPSLQVDKSQVHQRTIEFIDASAAAGHPWFVCNDEQLPAHEGLRPDADDPNHDFERRFALWGNLLGQGSGCEWYFGYAYDHSDLDCEDWRSRQNMWAMTRAAVTLLKQHVPYFEMQHADHLTADTGDFVLAKPGEAYAVFRPYGGSTQLDLGASQATFTVRWFDPKKGGPFKAGTVAEITGPGVVDIGEVPQYQDWLAWIERKSNGKPAVTDVAVDFVTLPGGVDVTISAHARDPEGAADVSLVGVHFVAPDGAYVGFVPLSHVGGDLYSAQAGGLPAIPSGTWSCYPIVVDQAGAYHLSADTFVSP